jgi:thiol-disulfide isomerase/thioredoxin
VCPLFLLLALSGCYTGSRPPRIGSSAPDFTVKDSDRTVALNQFRGQIVVLNFWATWCPPCVEEMPSLVEMQRRMKAKGVTVVAVSIDVDENAYRQFLKQHGVENASSLRDPRLAGDVHHRPKWGDEAEVHRGGGLDGAGDYGFFEQALMRRLSSQTLVCFFRPSGAVLSSSIPTAGAPSASSGQAVGCILSQLRG